MNITTPLNPVQPVGVRHEWGELREAIVGRQSPGALVVPPYYDGLRWMEGRMMELSKEHGGKFLVDVDPDFDAALTRQSDALAELLENRGVKVHRPTEVDPKNFAIDPEGYGSGVQLFPRDPLLVVGPWMIELNLRIRARRIERFALQDVLREAHLQGRGQWINMPAALSGIEADDTTSLFLEGGDTLLNGAEIYVGISGTSSNQGGIDWLQGLLGPSYHVQAVPLRSNVLHLDCAMALLRPGLGLLCRTRLAGELPPSLADFRWIDVTEEEASGLGTNGLLLSPETVIVEQRRERIMGEIRQAGMEVIPLAYDAPAAVGGAFRCSHHPLVRVS
jgi:glycine amidinotransferase